MNSEHEDHARIFKAFCDEKRLCILELLRSGEKCVCVLIEQLGLPQSTLSYHLKILCDSGIVDSRPDGKWTHYQLNPCGCAHAGVLLSQLTNISKTDDGGTKCKC